MQPIKPKFPSDPSLARPSKKANLKRQTIEGAIGGPTVCYQTWEESDGTEYELEMTVDDTMLEGTVISCQVSGSAMFCGSGVMHTGRMSSIRGSVSGVFIPGAQVHKKKGPTLGEVEGKKTDGVKGMDYDFSRTGIMKKKGSLGASKNES